MTRLLALTLSLLAAVPATAAPLKVLTYETRPFFYRDNGKPAGLEYEILEYFAKAKGHTLEVEFVDEFDSLVPRIARGEGDIAAATLTITPERQRMLGWSSPYFPVRVMLIEPREHSTQQLAKLAGATLATMKGTTYEKLLGAVPRAQMVYAADEEALFRLVSEGKARALAADSAVALVLLPKYPKLKLGIPLSAEQGLGFGVRQGSPLEAELSKHIQQLKASQIYFRLLEKHLGAEAAKLVAAGKG